MKNREEKSRKEEQKREREKVRRKKIQVREMLGKSRMICGSGGSKSIRKSGGCGVTCSDEK